MMDLYKMMKVYGLKVDVDAGCEVSIFSLIFALSFNSSFFFHFSNHKIAFRPVSFDFFQRPFAL